MLGLWRRCKRPDAPFAYLASDNELLCSSLTLQELVQLGLVRGVISGRFRWRYMLTPLGVEVCEFVWPKPKLVWTNPKRH